MAEKIKGITIEIGGDTAGLDKALKNVDSKARSLQNELKSVNAALKLDPKNVELLAQKQQLLTQAVSDTKEKVEALKQAKIKADKDMANGTEVSQSEYRKLEREIAFAENSLKKLEAQSSKTNQVLNKVSQASGKFSEGASKAGNAMLPLTGAIAGAGVAAITMANQFTDSMAKVSTIADTAQVPIDDLKNQILALSNQTGISANLIADDVYNAISAGQSTADAVNFVTNSTKLAKAGFAESSQALDVLTTILNAYGLEAEKVTDVSDMLIQVQNKGKTTVAELSANMGKVIPTAKGQNVALEQLGASYAIMTAKGIATAETTTYLNGMINELGKSSSISAKLLKEQTGKSFSELMASGKSLADVLKIVDDDAKKSGKSMGDMFGSAEAAKAALTLIDGGVNGFNKSVLEMQNSVGATDEAFEKLQTPSEKLKISLNAIKNAAIKMGDVLSPIFDKIAEIVKNVAGHLSGISEETMRTIATIAGIVAVIAPALIIAGKIAGVISAMSGAMAMLKTATLAQTIVQWGLNAALLASPITWIVIAVAALVAAFVLLWNNCEGFRNFWIGLWDEIVAAFNATVAWFKAAWTSMSDFFTNTWNDISSWFTNTLNVISDFFKNTWNGICDFFKGMLDGIVAFFTSTWNDISSWFTNTLNVISDFFKNTWNGICDFFKGMLDGIVAFFTSTWNGVFDFFSGILGGIKSIFLDVWNSLDEENKAFLLSIVGFFKNAWNGIKEFFITIWTSISTFASEMCNGFAQFLSGIWQMIGDEIALKWGAISDFFSGVWNGISEYITQAWEDITSYLSGVWNDISALAAIIFNAFKDSVLFVFNNIKLGITVIWDSIKQYFINLFEVIKALFNSLKDSIARIWENMKAIFNGIISFIRNVFTGNWEGAWEAVKLIFKNVFDSLVTIAKAPLNGIIGLVNLCIGGINMLIQGLNKISFDIPDWGIFGDLAGMTFGINIPKIPDIPYLAKGGILSQGSAITGEAGPELITMLNGKAIVRPLSGIAEGKSETGGTSYNQGASKQLIHITLIAEGKKLAEVITPFVSQNINMSTLMNKRSRGLT